MLVFYWTHGTHTHTHIYSLLLNENPYRRRRVILLHNFFRIGCSVHSYWHCYCCCSRCCCRRRRALAIFLLHSLISTTQSTTTVPYTYDTHRIINRFYMVAVFFAFSHIETVAQISYVFYFISSQNYTFSPYFFVFIIFVVGFISNLKSFAVRFVCSFETTVFHRSQPINIHICCKREKEK